MLIISSHEFQEHAIKQKLTNLFERYGIEHTHFVTELGIPERTENYRLTIEEHQHTSDDQLKEMERLKRDIGMGETNELIFSSDRWYMDIAEFLDNALAKAPQSRLR